MEAVRALTLTVSTGLVASLPPYVSSSPGRQLAPLWRVNIRSCLAVSPRLGLLSGVRPAAYRHSTHALHTPLLAASNTHRGNYGRSSPQALLPARRPFARAHSLCARRLWAICPWVGSS